MTAYKSKQRSRRVLSWSIHQLQNYKNSLWKWNSLIYQQSAVWSRENGPLVQS